MLSMLMRCRMISHCMRCMHAGMGVPSGLSQAGSQGSGLGWAGSQGSRAFSRPPSFKAPVDETQPSVSARPSFENAHLPADSFMFTAVNALLIGVLVAGCWLDLHMNNGLNVFG